MDRATSLNYRTLSLLSMCNTLSRLFHLKSSKLASIESIVVCVKFGESIKVKWSKIKHHPDKQ